jgi:hypothetical protein
MARKRKLDEPLVPEGSVNYALVKKGPVPRRRFRVGQVELARHAFSLIPRHARTGRRSGVWRTFVPHGRLETSATARRPRRLDGDVAEQLGLRPPDLVHGIPESPRYRPPGE